MALAYDSERLQESRFRDPWLGRTRQWRWQQATLPGSRAGTTQKAPATARSFSRLSCCRHARSWRGHRLWAARRHDHGGGRGQPCSPVPSGAPAGATAILCPATRMRSSLTWGGHHGGRHAGPPGRHDRCTQAPVQVPDRVHCGPDASPLPCQAHAARSRAKRAMGRRLTFSISPGEARIDGQRSRPWGPISSGAGPAGHTGCWPASASPAPPARPRGAAVARRGSALIQLAIAQVLTPDFFRVSGIVSLMRRAGAGGMRTLTTGLAGQQQARSARGGGLDQTPRVDELEPTGRNTCHSRYGPTGTAGPPSDPARGRSRVSTAASGRGQLRLNGVIDVPVDIVVTDAPEDAVTR
jgi:hypothetical protein